jgi:hypothetical protein
VNAKPSRVALLGNVVGYQVVWFACVAGAGSGRSWLGLLAALAFVVATLAFGGRRREDLRTLVILFPIGIGLDSLFLAMGWTLYSPAGPLPFLVPGWIAAIWLSFAMTLNHSMSFLRQNPWLAGVLGMVGAPLAYWSASRGFGVLSFGQPTGYVLLAMGLCWSLLLPLVFSLDRGASRNMELSP